MMFEQLESPVVQQASVLRRSTSYRDRFRALLASDLDFHDENSAYASHDFHAFPAKFPPQLPRTFIVGLTEPGDVVLDPMVGSGTTLVEAFLAGRQGLGFDIDPLALRLCQVKVTPLDRAEVAAAGEQVLYRARESVQQDGVILRQEYQARYGEAERDFFDHWFAPATQLELMALIREIERIPTRDVREFLELVFSAIIITKSGGVSLARDLAHTRPHRVHDKCPRSALDEYRKRLSRNLDSLASLTPGRGTAQVCCGNAQNLPLRGGTVDLIVTSPPYAANAIDYMRAHKFSLVWLGHPLANLSRLRRDYIGHDAVAGFGFAELPDLPSQVVAAVSRADPQKANVLHRYYSEMTRCLAEMARVLKPGKAAVVVVGSSTMRGLDTQTGACLGEIGRAVGLELCDIAVRRLDRDRRMMPARWSAADRSQIEERMHEEYVIGFLKPEPGGSNA